MGEDFAREVALLAEVPVTQSPSATVYTREDKLKAACAWLAWADREDSLTKCAEYAGINPVLLADWMQAEWWPSAIELARCKQGDKLDARLSDIINRASVGLLDRLENGDERLTRQGDVVRVAVGAKDLAVIAALALDKRQVLRGLPSAISRNESELSSIADKLKQLGARAATSPAAIGMDGRVIELKDKAA